MNPDSHTLTNNSNTTETQPCRFWAVIPAAGIGTRMATTVPKQYLDLNGKTILEHTITRLAGHPFIKGTVVSLADGDAYWDKLDFSLKSSLIIADGGQERCQSVLNGLVRLAEFAEPNDKVLVHDAARPCVKESDIDKLIAKLGDHPVGGLLGMPVRDTMKRADADGNVINTVDRRDLWHALTPQMFPLQLLKNALLNALERGVMVTDEASAMELQGLHPQLVQGSSDNIKITHPEDLPLAAFYLQQQEGSK